MTRLILQPTQLAQWYGIVNEAELVCHYQLPQDLESYLVFLLMRYMQKPEFSKAVLLEEFLQSLHQTGKLRSINLQDIGDKCLLLSGLYPERAKRQYGDIAFVCGLGKMAYRAIHRGSEHELYHELAKAWPALQNILFAIRFGEIAILEDTAFH